MFFFKEFKARSRDNNRPVICFRKYDILIKTIEKLNVTQVFRSIFGYHEK